MSQVRNASNSLAASLLPRRVDVRIAKTELWRSVEKHAPETQMSVVVSSANDVLTSASNPQAAVSSKQPVAPSTSKLSPQMAFVCLLHLANEHVSQRRLLHCRILFNFEFFMFQNLSLKTSEHFADIQVQTA